MESLVSDICGFAARARKSGALIPTPVPGLSILCDYEPTRLEAMVYHPVVCLVLQGVKETHIGSRCIRFGAGDSLIVSHSVPVVAAVTEASPACPYVAIVLEIDVSLARTLYDEIGALTFETTEACTLEVGQSDPSLIDAVGRLFRASLDTFESQAIAPLIMREIHLRLLRADHGNMLRQLLWRDSAASKIAKAIARIRADYTRALPISDLAKTAGMSVSAFHAHFKALTAKSPLQYQKELRLIEARRLLALDGASVSRTAFDVGYESSTQFSREYARKFGNPPGRDRIGLAVN